MNANIVDEDGILIGFRCSSLGQMLSDLHIITGERIILQLYEITQILVDFLQRYDNMSRETLSACRVVVVVVVRLSPTPFSIGKQTESLCRSKSDCATTVS